ncbi:uncharacterized protein OCT59_013734 [Rhizophagus irregularis]|nr:hypothetical protein OCT59_013734 [Rhizophagus irregularis]
MPKCECKHCLNLSNEEKEAQALEDEYQRLHPEENFYHSEEENLYEENLREEDLYEENERSFMVTSDNEEENERSYMEMCDNEEIPEETNDDFSFQNEENEKTNNYENDHYYYYENDDSISDSQNESESDNINSNADNEEDNTIISDELLEGLRLLYVKSNFNFSEAAFNNIYKAFNRNKMSLNKIKKILGSIVGIEPKIYDMCVNSCCAFVGVLENERKCKFCKEDRYYSNGKSRKNLPFVSIIERLKLQFKNSKRSKELLYRHNYTNNIGDLVHRDIGDIFDGLIYKELLNDAYFPDPRDVAFTASCDGYQIFRQKTDDYGILCYDGNKKEYFTLRAHILAWTGDLPALSKILYLTGHNSYSGCRFCNLRGTLNEMNRHVYYPLQQNIDPIRLPIRTHDEMLTSINQIEHLKGDRRETYIRNCGIKGKSILFELSSIKFPRSFPVDIMHLFFENIAPHMFRHWIGKFYPKNDERNSNNYTISSKTWIEIGEIMEKNRSNMPSDIGRPPRNIIKHSAGFKAVEWANWIILFSLPLLKGRLPQSYFLGWSNFVEAVQLCIQPRIDFEDLDKIRNLLIQFYNHYASSYGLEGERLPVYLISFHYSLHIGDCIEDLGPCRGFWQFPMERYCGMLIPLISSRKLPYVNLINNVLLQERFKYLQFLPTYDEKVFSNFKEKEKAWPSHRDIEESYMKYGKLRTKDGNIVSSKWWKKENDSSRNDYCVAINLTIDEQEEETFGQVEYFMLHNMQNQERMFAYIRKIKKLEKNIGNLKFFDCFGPLQYVEVIGIDRTVGFFEVYDKKNYYIIDKYANW